MRGEGEPRISAETRRNVLARSLLHVFPTELIGDASPFEKTRSFVKEGYGLVVVYNHFSKSDHIRALATVIPHVPEVAKRRLLSPVALHQDTALLRALQRASRVELRPIVTRDTVEKEKEGKRMRMPHSKERRKQYQDYIASARDVLSDGGTVAVAPQAGRRKALGYPPVGKPIHQLLSGYDNDRLVFLFAGLGIPGETDYGSKRSKGLNMRKKFTVQFAGPLTRDELLQMCERDETKIDGVVFEVLRTIIPEAYDEKRKRTD